MFGTVMDPSGGVVPGVAVSIQNEATGLARHSTTPSDGSYTFPDLPVGTYDVTAEMAGFKRFLQNAITLQVDENRRVPIQLQVGSTSENITVEAQVAQVETRTGTLREVIDSARTSELPLNGRNPLQLQYLVAGAGQVAQGGSGQAENQVVSINGARQNSNNYNLDGADNEDPFFNSPSVFPNPDALDEFDMQTSNYSADQGRNAGAVMNAVTKSGTNALHGTLFEFLRNQDLDTRNFFANSVSPFKRNQFGGAVGGPIRKDKTFFFASYQGTRVASSPGTQTPVVPTAAQRTGNFSGTPKALKDPVTNASFPGNIIPASELSLPVQNFINAFVPLPNAPNSVYTFASQQKTTDDQAVAKIDHSLATNNQLSGRLLFERNDTDQVPTNTTLPGFVALINYKSWNVAINDIHTFSPRLVNQFTFGFNDITRIQTPQIPSQKSWVDLGAGFVRAAPGPIAYDTEINGYFNAESRYLLNQYRKGFQYSDGLNWTVGAHSLRFGGDIRQNIIDQGQNFQTDPQVLFAATFTGLSLADFLAGRENSFTEGSPNAGRPRTLEPDLYVQDDWKVTRRLTLNLGLRWDPFLPYRDLNLALSQVRLGQQSTVYPTAPRGYVFPGDSGVSQTTINGRWANFAPRIGFAFDPFGNGRTSVRAGYGIFYSVIRGQALNNLSSNEPFALSLNVVQPSGGLVHPYQNTGNPFPFQPPATVQQRQSFNFFLPLTTITQFDPNFQNAQVQQWNFSVQQQLFSDWIVTAAYVGSVGHHLFLQNQLNPAIFGKAGSSVNARRLLAPTYTSIVDQLGVGNSSYNALQISANKKFQHGLTVLMNYTWSKSIDDASTDASQPADPFNINLDRAASDFDVPHRFVSSVIWQLPGVTGHGFLTGLLASGWEFNGILTLQSGSPFSVLSGVDNSQSGINLDRANVIGEPSLTGDRTKAQLIQRYFNTAAFTVNPLGTFGTSGRNILYGPGVVNLDFGIIKSFQLAEQYKFQFRAESFNAFNHANLGNPNATVSAATFGTITGTNLGDPGSPRVVQLALKLSF